MIGREIQLSEICDTIQYGYTASASTSVVGPKFLRITDIVDDYFSWDKVPYCKIPESDFEKYRLSTGDIVIARTGATTGYAHYIQDCPNAVFASYLIRIQVNLKFANPRFIGAIVSSHAYKQYVKSNWGGAAQPNANAKILTAFKFFLPDLEIQRKIVTILSSYDDLITVNQRRIQLLEESARLLYREWFVKLRFPGYESVAVKDGTPEGWRMNRLARVADVNRSSLSSKDKPESILYVDISTVTPGEIGEYREFSFEDAPGRARRKVAHGDIIWSCVRPNRRSYALIWEPDERVIVSTGFAVLTAIALPFSYLYLATTTDEFVGYLEKRATGAAYPAVTGKDFENAPILLPDKGTLNQFNKFVLPMLEQAEILKCQNKKLRQARDLPLPKLMSGALDVSRIALPDEATV